ncbi:hypothetical protein [Brackiella oedipodis]|uniref:hypothetical protein n=1 Tax=Brackiella oedipodis TaxID=124225 RepID=UPI00048B7F03|nr:hypothetical protein [Brackiella oedipodis]
MQRLFVSLLALFCSSQALADSGLPAVLKDYGHEVACAAELDSVAQALIGKNTSRLYIDASSPQSSYPVINGVLDFQDRNALLALHAYPSAAQQCQIAIEESFVLTDPCISIREEIFSKWSEIGRLNEATSVYKKNKSPYSQIAYLTTAMKSSPMCLVHIHRDVDSAVTAKDIKLK